MTDHTTLTKGRQRHRLSKGQIVVALLALGVVGFSAGFAGASASAGTAESQVGAFSAGGRTYYDGAYIRTSSKNAQASSAIYTPGSSNYPTGYFGARGRLFIGGSTSNMSCEGTTQYSSGPLTLFQAFSCTRGTAGTWNSYGVVYGYNGSGYQAQYTFNSPNQTS